MSIIRAAVMRRRLKRRRRSSCLRSELAHAAATHREGWAAGRFFGGLLWTPAASEGSASVVNTDSPKMALVATSALMIPRLRPSHFEVSCAPNERFTWKAPLFVQSIPFYSACTRHTRTAAPWCSSANGRERCSRWHRGGGRRGRQPPGSTVISRDFIVWSRSGGRS